MYTKQSLKEDLKGMGLLQTDAIMIHHIQPIYQKLTISQSKLYDRGVAKKVRFGDAVCIFCEARGVFEVTGDILKKELNCLIAREEIPKEWWKSQRKNYC